MSKKYIESYLAKELKKASVTNDTSMFGDIQCTQEEFFNILSFPVYLEWLAQSVIDMMTDAIDIPEVLAEATEEFFNYVDVNSAMEESSMLYA